MFFVVWLNNSFNFPLGLIKYIVTVTSWDHGSHKHLSRDTPVLNKSFEPINVTASNQGSNPRSFNPKWSCVYLLTYYPWMVNLLEVHPVTIAGNKIITLTSAKHTCIPTIYICTHYSHPMSPSSSTYFIILLYVDKECASVCVCVCVCVCTSTCAHECV